MIFFYFYSTATKERANKRLRGTFSNVIKWTGLLIDFAPALAALGFYPWILKILNEPECGFNKLIAIAEILETMDGTRRNQTADEAAEKADSEK